MSVVYSYPVSSTATNAVNLEQLAAEIERNDAISSVCEGGVVIDAITLDIYFSTALSVPEQAQLTATVAAHTPSTPTSEPALLTDTNVIFDSQGRLVYDTADRVLVTS